MILELVFLTEVHGLYRIVGGSPADEFPHIVFVRVFKGAVNYQCAGSLVDSNHVVTAAHCISGNIREAMILFGHTNMQKFPSKIYVSHYEVHSGYKLLRDSVVNDVAVLTLSEPIKFTKCIKPIRMAEPGEEFVGDCNIAGWGTQGRHLPPSKILLRADVPLISPEVCSDFGAYNQHVCAGNRLRNGQSTWQGDSGGPLMCTSGTDGAEVLTGIVSYGWTCSEGMAVYTKVSYFKDWISKHVQPV